MSIRVTFEPAMTAVYAASDSIRDVNPGNMTSAMIPNPTHGSAPTFLLAL